MASYSYSSLNSIFCPNMFKHCPLHRLSHLTSWSVQLPYTYYGLLPNPTDSLLPRVSQLILEGGHVLIGLQCAILFSFMCDILNGALGILFYNLTLPITSPQLHFYPVCSSPWSSWCSLFVHKCPLTIHWSLHKTSGFILRLNYSKVNCTNEETFKGNWL